MNSFFYLFRTKIKGSIRVQFSSLGTGMAVIFMVLIYGVLIGTIFTSSVPYQSETMYLQTAMAILAGVGVTAFFSLLSLMSKRKALLYDTDAFYFFSGPYTKTQTNLFILVQTLKGALGYGLIGCFFTGLLSMGRYFSIPYFLLCLLVFFLISAVFLLMTDYIYMWTLVKPKVKIWNYIAVVLVLAAAGGVFFISMQAAGYDFKDGFLKFAVSREFYYVPFFGWGKLVLSAFLGKEYMGMIIGLALLLLANAVFVILFLTFPRNIVEQAVRDAEEISNYVRRVKANGGNILSSEGKIKQVRGEFPEGARAIFYKNILSMKKTGSFLRKQDFFVIVVYFLISYFMIAERRFYMFSYMMILWLFNLLNDTEFLGDLKNYQIYLIPENPLKKLIYVVLPAYFKISILIGTAILIAGIFNRMPVLTILQYFFMLLGYAMIFISGTVWATKIMKTKASVALENLLRMLIILLAAIPATGAGFLAWFLLKDLYIFQIVVTVITIVMNFLVSAIILIACQGMMNGREI